MDNSNQGNPRGGSMNKPNMGNPIGKPPPTKLRCFRCGVKLTDGQAVGCDTCFAELDQLAKDGKIPKR